MGRCCGCGYWRVRSGLLFQRSQFLEEIILGAGCLKNGVIDLYQIGLQVSGGRCDIDRAGTEKAFVHEFDVIARGVSREELFQ